MLLLIWRTVVITVLVFPGNLEEDLRRNLNPSPGPRQVTFGGYWLIDVRQERLAQSRGSLVPEGPNVYRLLSSIKFFAPAERNAWFDVFIYQYIALRWSAKHWLVAKSINIWLLWSQDIIWLRLRAAPMLVGRGSAARCAEGLRPSDQLLNEFGATPQW